MLPNIELVVRLVAGVISVIGRSGRSMARNAGRWSTPSASQTNCTLPPGIDVSELHRAARRALHERQHAIAERQPSDPLRAWIPLLWIETQADADADADLVVGSALADARDDGRRLLHHERPVAADDLVDLELRGGRQAPDRRIGQCRSWSDRARP